VSQVLKVSEVLQSSFCKWQVLRVTKVPQVFKVRKVNLKVIKVFKVSKVLKVPQVPKVQTARGRWSWDTGPYRSWLSNLVIESLGRCDRSFVR
jgi:hypothetical protein